MAAPYDKALEDKIVKAFKRHPYYGGMKAVGYECGVPLTELRYWLRLGELSENGKFSALSRRVKAELAKAKKKAYDRVEKMANGYKVTTKTSERDQLTGELRVVKVVEEHEFHPAAAIKLYDEFKEVDGDRALLDVAPGEDAVQNMAEMFAYPNPEILEALRRALLLPNSELRGALERDGHVFNDRGVPCKVLRDGSPETPLLESAESGRPGS